MGLFNFNKKKNRICVLHIDDSRWVRIPVSVLLRRHFGMRVLEADNGPEGVRIAETEQPDLIILDVMMPMVNGFTVLSQLKENVNTKDIPVLMCTVRDLTSEVNVALRLGALGYLTKPIEEELLVNKVRELLISIGKWSEITEAGGRYKDMTKLSTVDIIQPADSRREVEPIASAMPSPHPPRQCPSCQNGLAYVPQYDAWYCYPCRKYPDSELV